MRPTFEKGIIHFCFYRQWIRSFVLMPQSRFQFYCNLNLLICWIKSAFPGAHSPPLSTTCNAVDPVHPEKVNGGTETEVLGQTGDREGAARNSGIHGHLPDAAFARPLRQWKQPRLTAPTGHTAQTPLPRPLACPPWTAEQASLICQPPS